MVKQWLKSEFARHFRTLFAGNVAAQVTALITLPLLTRIYTPEQFGQLALFVSLVTILSQMGTARMEMAIVLSGSEGEADCVAAVARRFLTICCLVVGVAILFILPMAYIRSGWLSVLLLVLLPISAWCMGERNIRTYRLNREKHYLPIAKSRFFQAGSNSISALLIGLSRLLSVGLIIGFTLSLWVEMRVLRGGANPVEGDSQRWQLVKRYKNFPLFSLPMAILNSLSTDILIYFFSFFYTPLLAGLYHNARRVLQFPLRMVSHSFVNVFYRQLTESTNPTRFYLLSFVGNLLGAALLLFPIALWGEPLFRWLLGDQWGEAGRFATILTPLVATHFAASNVSTVYDSLQKNQYELVWQVLYFGAIFLLLLGSVRFGCAIEGMLILFSLIGTLFYLLSFGLGYWLLSRSTSPSFGKDRE